MVVDWRAHMTGHTSADRGHDECTHVSATAVKHPTHIPASSHYSPPLETRETGNLQGCSIRPCVHRDHSSSLRSSARPPTTSTCPRRNYTCGEIVVYRARTRPAADNKAAGVMNGRATETAQLFTLNSELGESKR
ncbi:hypothetical protein J6590_039378 [Homalodisca vitripennis]|nr:hypothetical protein J6590_039378 [Homalodisca vitripennis]